jgi:hypothetical protein
LVIKNIIRRKKMNKTIEDYFFELNDMSYAKIINDRLPCGKCSENPFKLEIEIIAKKLNTDGYIDVAFCFTNAEFPRDAFYTHIYTCDILKNCNLKLI